MMQKMYKWLLKMTKLYVKDEYLNMLLSIFEDYCPKAKIWAYGSILGGDAHSGSDLDLVVKDFGDKNCSLSELKNLFSESDMPFLIDIVVFDDLPKSFQDEILKNYLVIYPVI